MFLTFLVEWILKCLNKLFGDFFFKAGDILFDLAVSVKFVNYLFKVCDMFLLS